MEPGTTADKVTITPWQAGIGCLCESSLELARTAVASVSVTDHVHVCCGKSLKVVEIEFAGDTGKHWTDVFSQLTRRAAALRAADVPHRADAFGPARPDISDCPHCVAVCSQHPGSPACTACWEACNRGAYARPSRVCPPGTEYCECINACVAPWVCWRRCGAHG